MSITQSVDEIIAQHVFLEIESIDRMYLNLYMDGVQSEGGTADFFVRHRKEACVTALVMSQMTRKFISNIENFAQQQGIEIIAFGKHVRKDDIAKQQGIVWTLGRTDGRCVLGFFSGQDELSVASFALTWTDRTGNGMSTISRHGFGTPHGDFLHFKLQKNHLPQRRNSKNLTQKSKYREVSYLIVAFCLFCHVISVISSNAIVRLLLLGFRLSPENDQQ